MDMEGWIDKMDEWTWRDGLIKWMNGQIVCIFCLPIYWVQGEYLLVKKGGPIEQITH